MPLLRVAVVLVGFLALPGCSLIGGGRTPKVEPEYHAVSSAAVPLWRGDEDESIPHLRLRLWLLDSDIGRGLANTFDPQTKIAGIQTLLRQGDDGRVRALVFRGADRITPAGRDHYCIVYGSDESVLWSEADGFEPLVLPKPSNPWWVNGAGGAVAVIPGQAIMMRVGDRLLAMDWRGEFLRDQPWPDELEIDAVFSVLDDSAILVAHEELDGQSGWSAGASLWRPGEGPHRIANSVHGGVQGPSNAFFGFHHDRDRIVRLEWPTSERPSAARVLKVSGWGRTASAMSPDGRFVVSGDPGFKVLRNDPRYHEVHENGRRLTRRVGDPENYRALDPVWLLPTFGAPESVTIIERQPGAWPRVAPLPPDH